MAGPGLGPASPEQVTGTDAPRLFTRRLLSISGLGLCILKYNNRFSSMSESAPIRSRPGAPAPAAAGRARPGLWFSPDRTDRPCPGSV